MMWCGNSGSLVFSVIGIICMISLFSSFVLRNLLVSLLLLMIYRLCLLVVVSMLWCIGVILLCMKWMFVFCIVGSVCDVKIYVGCM